VPVGRGRANLDGYGKRFVFGAYRGPPCEDALGADRPVGLVLRSSRPPGGRGARCAGDLVRRLAAEPGGLGALYCLGAVVDLEFGEDVADVVAYGLG